MLRTCKHFPQEKVGQKGGSWALVAKYKIMHLGNANEFYMILHSELVVTTQEIHVGSSIKSSLKALARCATDTKDDDNVNSAVNNLNKAFFFLG